MSEPQSHAAGTVYLVGAGPGEPGLITLRGADCLRCADVVVYDALVNPRLLELAPDAAERVAVGKRHGKRSMPQEAIHELLLRHARAGKNVVRLKGGDPLVFGRGGEEAAALRAAGLPYEIVPGVTAGVAVPAFAGIPVTHREYASAVAFVTAHEDPCKPSSTLDWPALARFPGTLVFYMGVARLPGLAEALQRHGMPADTPVAVIAHGTTPAQRSVRGTLSDIARQVESERVCAPAVIVVGRVVNLADQVAWFENRPLFGQRVVVTRPAHQAGGLVEQLAALGSEVLELPAVRIEPPADGAPVDRAIAELDDYGWLVFTSANGVRSFLDRVRELGHDARLLGGHKIAAIGAATSRELERYQLKADLRPAEARSESLAAALGQAGPKRPLLLLRAEQGREVLADDLRAAAVPFHEVAVYRSVEHELDRAILDRMAAGEVDWITLTSAGIARAVLGRVPSEVRAQIGKRIRVASISPITSATVRELGGEVAAEAGSPSTEALVQAILYASSRQVS